MFIFQLSLYHQSDSDADDDDNDESGIEAVIKREPHSSASEPLLPFKSVEPADIPDTCPEQLEEEMEDGQIWSSPPTTPGDSVIYDSDPIELTQRSAKHGDVGTQSLGGSFSPPVKFTLKRPVFHDTATPKQPDSVDKLSPTRLFTLNEDDQCSQLPIKKRKLANPDLAKKQKQKLLNSNNIVNDAAAGIQDAIVTVTADSCNKFSTPTETNRAVSADVSVSDTQLVKDCNKIMKGEPPQAPVKCNANREKLRLRKGKTPPCGGDGQTAGRDGKARRRINVHEESNDAPAPMTGNIASRQPTSGTEPAAGYAADMGKNDGPLCCSTQKTTTQQPVSKNKITCSPIKPSVGIINSRRSKLFRPFFFTKVEKKNPALVEPSKSPSVLNSGMINISDDE